MSAKMAATRILPLLVLLYFTSRDTVFHVFLPHGGGSGMCDSLKSFSEVNEGILDLFVQHVVRRVDLSRRYRNSTSLPLRKWAKHGQISLVIPGHDPPQEITIFMDIAKNPGPIIKLSTHISCEERSALNLHVLPQQLTLGVSYSLFDVLVALFRRFKC